MLTADNSGVGTTLGRYRLLLRGNSGAFVFLAFVSLVLAAAQLMPPLVAKKLINTAASHGNLGPAETISRLIWIGSLGAGLYILTYCLSVTRAACLDRISTRVAVRLKRRLFRHLLLLPLRIMSEIKSGGVIGRLNGDPDAMAGMIERTLVIPYIAGIKIIATVAIISIISWELAIATLVFSLVAVFLSRNAGAKARNVLRKAQAENNELNSRLVETFAAVRVVRAFGQESREERSFVARAHSIARRKLRALRRTALVTHATSLLANGSTLCVLCYGGTLVAEGRASVGDLLAVVMYANLILAPISDIIKATEQSQAGLIAAERIEETLGFAAEDRPGRARASSPVRRIAFEAVSFSYEHNQQILRDITFSVEAPAIIAIVGRSGAGKSTLIDLLMRFQRPSSGRILVDGEDISMADLGAHRSKFGLVQQEALLFDGTVADNVRYGRKDATEMEVRAALDAAQLTDWVESLPMKMQTLLGDKGHRLSGGQRQRLSIARAVLMQAPVLIFDEATSSLDSETEKRIKETISAVCRNRIAFLVAHRLSTIDMADLVVVMDSGRIVETGSPRDLLVSKGAFRSMVDAQMFRSPA